MPEISQNIGNLLVKHYNRYKLLYIHTKFNSLMYIMYIILEEEF